METEAEPPNVAATEGGRRESGGVRYNGKIGELSASEKSVSTVLQTAENISNRGFEWAERNPWLFCAVLLFLLLAILIWSRGRVKIAAQKNEYRNRRLEPKGQIVLPLPKPDAQSREE